MKTIERTTTIQATPAEVWRVLTDTDSYGQWNPFMPRLQGPLRVGERFAVTIRPGKRTMTFRPTLRAFDERKLICWQGRLGIPGIFDGVHSLKIEPAPAGATRFTQHEAFSGVLVPMMRGVLRDTAAGFAAMNDALRLRAEEPSTARTSPHHLDPAADRQPPTGKPRDINAPAVRPRVAIRLAAGLLIVAAFQAALTFGAPLGAAAQGGTNPGQLPDALRVVTGLSAIVWLFATLLVLARGGRAVVAFPEAVSRVGTWVLVGLLGVGALLNFASSSPWERFGWGPFTLLLFTLGVVLARNPMPSAARLPEPIRSVDDGG